MNIGALLLAKRLSEFPEVSLKAARVITYAGNSKMNTKSDITGEKGYAVGFVGLVNYVMGQLPQNEVIKKALRKKEKLLPEIVIRELLDFLTDFNRPRPRLLKLHGAIGELRIGCTGCWTWSSGKVKAVSAKAIDTPAIFNQFRQLANNILRQTDSTLSMKAKRFQAAIDDRAIA